jgi:hypothetical protein
VVAECRLKTSAYATDFSSPATAAHGVISAMHTRCQIVHCRRTKTGLDMTAPSGNCWSVGASGGRTSLGHTIARISNSSPEVVP